MSESISQRDLRNAIFAEMDPARMTPLARRVFLGLLTETDRLDEAVRRFPNLEPLTADVT